MINKKLPNAENFSSFVKNKNVPYEYESQRINLKLQSGRRLFCTNAGGGGRGNDGDGANKAESYYRKYEEIFGNVPSDGDAAAETEEVELDQEKRSRDDMTRRLSHVDAKGRAKMVDVGEKTATRRIAVAIGRVTLPEAAFRLVVANGIAKGDVLTVAQLAGIVGVKRTSDLISLCHNVVIENAKLDLTLNDEFRSVDIICTVSTFGKTGVEMEALTGVTVASLAVYDMCKSVSHDIAIGDIKLVRKSGGRSGEYDVTNI